MRSLLTNISPNLSHYTKKSPTRNLMTSPLAENKPNILKAVHGVQIRDLSHREILVTTFKATMEILNNMIQDISKENITNLSKASPEVNILNPIKSWPQRDITIMSSLDTLITKDIIPISTTDITIPTKVITLDLINLYLLTKENPSIKNIRLMPSLLNTIQRVIEMLTTLRV
jgi:hypothetical protein